MAQLAVGRVRTSTPFSVAEITTTGMSEGPQRSPSSRASTDCPVGERDRRAGTGDPDNEAMGPPNMVSVAAGFAGFAAHANNRIPAAAAPMLHIILVRPSS